MKEKKVTAPVIDTGGQYLSRDRNLRYRPVT